MSKFSSGAITKIALFVMFPLCVLYFAWLCWRAGLPLQIDVNEAWNAWHADRLGKGLPLYPNANELIVNNYPPLSFYILEYTSQYFSNAIFAGRWLSLVSIVLIGGNIFILCRIMNIARTEASLGAVWYITTMARFFYEYAGMNDPNLLALAVMSTGFVLFIKAQQTMTKYDILIYASFSLMLLGGLIKHNLIGLPLAAFVLLYKSNKIIFYRCVLLCCSLVTIALFSLHYLYGNSVFEQILMPRAYDILRPLSRIGRLQWIILVLIFWLIWLAKIKSSKLKSFTIIIVSCTFFSNEIALFGEGVANNAQFELIFASGICLAVIIGDLYHVPLNFKKVSTTYAIALLSLIFVRFFAWPEFGPYLFLTSQSYKDAIEERVRITNAEIQRITNLQGNINCSIRNVCYFAKKDFVFDDFAMGQKIKVKAMTKEELRDELNRKNIQLVKIDENARWHLP